MPRFDSPATFARLLDPAAGHWRGGELRDLHLLARPCARPRARPRRGVDGAHARFEAITGLANDVGLLSEEVDGSTGERLGNYSQAFTHIGLVNAASAIAEAERRGRQA
jgi:GH15 family glucan-1,4-alpha-glucosidase